VRLRALEHLDLTRSWVRVLGWARGDIMDVPDRLPYELAHRVWSTEPELSREHDVQPVQLVMATKPGTQTIRPFVRPHVRDMLLYQALVDALQAPIEASLPGAATVYSYRLSPLRRNDAFGESPKWANFARAAAEGLENNPGAFGIRSDLTSFFLTIDIERLERRLLEIGADATIVADLGALLKGWQHQGIRGLPQGLPPSGPLANVYLGFLDKLVESEALPYWRYSDDAVAVAPTFARAREVLDRMERELYERGMSLGGAKTSIRRTENVLNDFRPPDEDIDDELREMLESVGDYGPTDSDIEEARLALIKEMFDGAIAKLRRDTYPRFELTHAFRTFARARDGHALSEVPYVLTRMPGLTTEAMRYVTKLRARDRASVATALSEIISAPFLRDQEWVHVLRAALRVSGRGLAGQVEQFERLADDHESPLVRARALLAWGRHSPADDLDAAERFFRRERRMWLGYAIAALKDKEPARAGEALESWSSEGRSISRVISSLADKPLSWAHM